MKELADPSPDAEDTPDLHVAFARHHALVVGVDSYFDPRIGSLRTAVNDARKVADVLHREHGFAEADMTLLCNADATRERVLHELGEAMPKRVGERDRLFVYLACHGLTIERDQGPQGHLLLHDACYEEPETFLSMAELDELLGRLSCRHTLMVLDCCFAGAFRWTTRNFLVRKRPLYREHFDYYVRSKSWHAIASAAYDETAADVYRDLRGREGDHSPFARALLDGLKGEADSNGDGFITSCELLAFIDGRMRTCGAKPQTPEMFALRNHQRGYFLFQHPDPLRRHPLEAAPEFQPHRNPYRGLESFGEQEQDRFFGRQRATEKLREAVLGHALTVVLAPSGLGKSSLVKAGLAPTLRREGWHIGEVVRLGEHPLRSLEDALASNRVSRTSLPPAQALAPSLLIIDQLEEVFTICRDQVEREAFLARLGALLALDGAPKVVATLRSDFEPLFAEGALRTWWGEGRFLVDPMSREELEEAVRRPAELHALYFDPPRLVDELIGEVQQRPAALPMLSFALQQLYLRAASQHPDERALRHSDYEAFGGLAGAIQDAAQRQFEHLVGRDPNYQNTIRNVMLRMVSTEGGAPARRRVADAEFVYQDSAENRRVEQTLKAFTQARLLVRDADEATGPYVEPAHDILVRSWKQMLSWRDEAAASNDLVMQQQARTAATHWQAEGKPRRQEVGAGAWRRWRLKRTQDNNLWGDTPLLQLLVQRREQNPGLLNQLEAGFVTASAKRVRYVKAITRLTVATTMLVLTGLTLWATRQADRATTEASKAKIAEDKATSALKGETEAKTNAEEALKGETEAKIKAEEALKQETKAKHEAERNQAISEGGRASTLSHQPAGLPLALEGALQAASSHLNELSGLDTLWGALFETVHRATESEKLPGRDLRVARFVPNSQTIVTVDGGGVLRQLRPAPGGFASTELGVGDFVLASSSAAGGLLATADRHGGIAAWPAGSVSAPEASPCERGLSPSLLLVSPDERLVLSSGPGLLPCLWNRSSRSPTLLTGHRDPLRTAAFSPDGHYAVTASGEGVMQFWDARSGELIGPLSGHAGMVLSASFCPTAPRFVTAGVDGVPRLWSYEGPSKKKPPSLVKILPRHEGAVTGVAYSPDGAMLLTSSRDGKARLWDATTGASRGVLEGHNGPITTVQFSPDGTPAAGGADGTVRLWDASTGLPTHVLEGHGAEIKALSFSGDGTQVLSASGDGTALVWNLHSNRTLRSRLRHENGSDVTALAFSIDGKHLATGSHDGSLYVWDAKSGARAAPPLPIQAVAHGHAPLILALVFSADGRALVASTGSGLVFRWHWQTGQVIALGNVDHAVRDLALSDDGRLLTAASDGGVYLWDMKAGTALRPLGLPAGPVAQVSFLPGSRHVLTAGPGHEAHLWDADQGRSLGASLQSESDVTSATLSPDGQTALITSTDEQARLWPVPAGHKPLHAFRHATPYLPPSFSPTRPLVMTTSAKDTVQLWNTSTGRAHGKPLKHGKALVAASFSPSGRHLATLDDDGVLLVWGIELSQPIATFKVGRLSSPPLLAFSGAEKEGRLAVSSGPQILLFSIDPRELFDMGCETIARRADGLADNASAADQPPSPCHRPRPEAVPAKPRQTRGQRPAQRRAAL